MKHIGSISLAALFALSLAACTGAPKESDGAADSAGARAAVGDARTLTVGVEGMQCPYSCPPAVQAALEGVAGVQQVEVDYEGKRARITAAPDADPEALVAALEDAGYEAQLEQD